jgi:hypothetical protein
MKTLEFEASLNPDSTLRVPQEIAAQLQPDQPVRVIVLIPDAAEEHDWSRMTAEQFLAGYADSDAIYDELPAR